MSRLEIKTSKGVNYVNADYTIEEKQGEYPKLTCTIPASKNKIWIDDCKELDRLYTPGEQDEFVIINPVKITKGDSYDLEITAVGAFEFDFVKSRINDNLPTRSYTVEYLLDLVFKDTRYSYDLQGTYEKREFTNFGSDNRYKLFLQIMNRFNLEFKIIGKIVRINSKIGNDTGFQFRYLKNIKDTKYSVDATNLVTHVKGYGAYHDANDQSKGRLEVEYLSPLSDIYGKLSGEPVVDERMSISATLLEKCKQSVESSVAVTVSTTLVALKNQEYRGIARVGDSIWFIDERIELEKKIRFSTVKSYYDAFDELIKQDVQLGDKDVFSRAQSSDSASQSKLIDKQKELSDQLADVEDAIKKTYVMPSGVNRVFYSSDLPEDVPKGTIKEGDTLFRNIDGETKMYRWDGVQWELVPVVNHVEKFREELDNEIAQVNTSMQAQAQEHDRQVADILSKTQSVESLANQAKSDATSALARANQVKTEAIADARVQVATVSQALNTAKSELQSAIASADQKARDSQASATALRADLNLQASKILAQAQAQTALTNRVSTVETLADGTKTTVAELSKTVSKATGDIASVTSRTKTVEDTLSQTRTQYEALTQTVNTQTGQIESINRKTADLQSGIDGVTERFESLRIEDNLLLNSSFNQNLNQWQGTGVTIVDGKARITGEFNKTKYIYQSIKSQIANDGVSQVYIASISVKVTNYVAGSINPFLALYISGRKNDSVKTWFGATYLTAARLEAVNNRGVVQFTTTFKVNVPRSQIGSMEFNIYARDFTGEVEFEKVSLRRGNIDLGWQASPEDLRSEIATYKRTAEESSAELSRQIQLADGKAVEAKTYAQQTAEGFKTRLESLETYKNEEGTRASQYFT
ncbi:TPA: phage tail protein, partial [Streptococcus suis]|nr:phage tail protein [Streptococcus suis]